MNLDGCIHDGWFVVRDYEKLLNKKYLYHFMSSPLIQKQYKTLSAGGVVSNISSELVYSVKLNIPSKEEQLKVAKFLSLLDKKIELRSKKIEDLKLFTKKKATELLLDLNKECITESIENICNIQTGKSNTQDKNDLGVYPFYIRSEKITHSNKYIFDCEAVLTIGDGNIGKVFFYENGKFDCHQRVYVMNNFRKDVLGKYFYYYFSNNFYKRAMSMSAKNTVDSVRLEMIAKMKINIPKLEIQNIIITILSSFDKKIELEQTKLKKLQELKKGLMQNMFV